MNKQRKLRFNDVIDFLEEAYDELEDIQNDEADALDALSDGLLDSGRGDKMEEYISLMDDAMTKIHDVITFINESIIKKK